MSVNPSVRPSTRLSVRPSVCPPVGPSIAPSVCPVLFSSDKNCSFWGWRDLELSMWKVLYWLPWNTGFKSTLLCLYLPWLSSPCHKFCGFQSRRKIGLLQPFFPHLYLLPDRFPFILDRVFCFFVGCHGWQKVMLTSSKIPEEKTQKIRISVCLW